MLPGSEPKASGGTRARQFLLLADPRLAGPGVAQRVGREGFSYT